MKILRLIKRSALLIAGMSALFTHLVAGQRKTTPQPEINFTAQNLASAVKLSKQIHKPIFVDAYAVWCAPCRELKRSTFKDSKVAAYFNTHYINVTIDVEKPAGADFADRYEVSSYPTLLFISEDGKVMKRIEGFVDAKQLIAATSSLR